MTTEALRDAAERTLATDPGRSFIIQAPAGSGKTELLTQRYLRLLARVDDPRQVLAITFTRKATQEMTARIRRRLQEAASGITGDSEHERQSLARARAVLERGRALGWQLLEDPQQLQVLTIDGLCARLAALGAAETGALPPARVMDDASPLYAEAARRTLEHAASLAEGTPARTALEGLLPQLHGNAQTLCSLLANALGRRDQWLAGAIAGEAQAAGLWRHRQARELAVLESALGEAALGAMQEAVVALAELCPPGDARAAPVLAAQAAAADTPGDPDAAVQFAWRVLGEVTTKGHLPYAAGSVARYVLVQAGPDGGPLREDIGEILAAWRDDAHAVAALQRFLVAPPLALASGDPHLLQGLRALLVLACGELHALFAEQGACDFPFIAHLAQVALGADLDPGRALLIEDGRLQHILVDEFQDTSQGQYELLEALTSGWEPGDGRTLFLVGDPMQSIYRFRKAEVGLYLSVFDAGALGGVPLEALRLSCNFRSRSELVAFVNARLPEVFGASSPLSPGTVGYTPFHATQGIGGRVHLEPAPPGGDAAEEAGRIAQAIAAVLARDPGASVGVLARARAHLVPVAAALARHGLPYEAVEVRALAERQVVQDLLALVRALLHPADRVAWLAVLHAPWLGLDPAELLQAGGATAQDDVLARLGDPSVLAGFADRTRERLRAAHATLSAAVAAGARLGLRRRVEAAWVRLGGPFAIEWAQDLDDAQAFLDLLSAVEAERPEDLLETLEHRLERLYAGSRRARVQLMTMHKAKGLEFDEVFLPRLDYEPPTPGQELFRMQELQHSALGRATLFAPVAGGDLPSVYGYLGRQEREAQECEAQRLLYVALTRARRGVHLFGRWALRGSGSARAAAAPGRSFMAMLWPDFAPLVAHQAAADDAGENPAPALLPMLRLEGAPAPALAPTPPQWADASLPEGPDDAGALALGQAFHRWLELIHDHWDESWLDAGWIERRAPALRSSLRQAGAPAAAVPGLLGRLAGQLRTALANPQVRGWLSGQAQGSHSELVLLRRDGVHLERRVVDLLVADAHGGWLVVDWKTSQGQAGDAWRDQLGGYARRVAAAGLGAVVGARVYQPQADQVLDIPLDAPDDPPP